MADDGIVRIGTSVDVSSLKAGMDQAANVVSAGTKSMSASMAEATAASQRLAEAQAELGAAAARGNAHPFPIVAFGHFAIGPETRRDIRLGLMLARREAVERREHQRVGDELLHVLQNARDYPGDVMRRDPCQHDDAYADKAKNYSY